MTKRQKKQRKGRLKRWIRKATGWRASDPLTKSQLMTELRRAHRGGTLVSDKHNPFKLARGKTYRGRRTVISHQTMPQLDSLLASGFFSVSLYDNLNPRHSLKYYALTPTISSLTFVGSGILPMSNVPINTCDTMIAVHGRGQGWHVFAELNSNIARNSQLRFNRPIP